MKHRTLVILSGIFFSCSACKPALKSEALIGKWKYVKVETPQASPPDSIKKVVIEQASPYITFSKNDSVKIIWSDSVLSHGTYRLSGNNIQVKEILAGGKSREFPFYISKLDKNNLIFESLGEDGSKVTAVKDPQR